jgi:hypothetical protein
MLRGGLRFVPVSLARGSRFVQDWVLTTNHKRLAMLYFFFVVCAGILGLILATVIRLELAYPGQMFIVQNPERYLTIVSLHGIVMVFFVVIPLIFGAFGNYLLPLELGVRDVAFPRLNSFMFWLTPSGLILLMHTLYFDRANTAVHWLNYGEQRALLRRRYASVLPEERHLHELAQPSLLAWRLASPAQHLRSARAALLREVAPALTGSPVEV